MSSQYKDFQEHSKRLLGTYLKLFRSRLSADSSFIDEAARLVIDELIDDIMLETVAEIHRWSVKANEVSSYCAQLEKEPEEFFCPHCTEKSNGLRYGRHLETCMGIKSRKSARLITLNTKGSKYNTELDDEYDDDLNSRKKKNNKIIKKSAPPKKKIAQKKQEKKSFATRK